MLFVNMYHQMLNCFDNGSTLGPQPSKENFDNLISLLVKKEIKNLISKTSNPKRVQEPLVKYVGIQMRHQVELGRIWFMRQMLRQNIFSHEIQVISAKTVFGYKQRGKNLIDSRILRQCRSVIEVRLKMSWEYLRTLHKDNLGTVRVLDSILS